ncbi:MAG: hypothetical protein FJ029_08185 [Actinobacteria bacterium]|nr:hypothetical protein [Actinomycetota bacterium]
MGYLAVTVLSNVLFALGARLAQAWRYDFFFVSWVNYATALLAALAWGSLTASWWFDPVAVGLGVASGGLYPLGFAALFLLMARSGVGIAFSIVRYAVLMPTLVSIIVFGERPGAVAVAGLALLMVSMPLLTARGATPAARPTLGSIWAPLAVIMLITGTSSTLQKVYVQLGDPRSLSVFVTAVFGGAVPLSVVPFLLRRRLQPDAVYRVSTRLTSRRIALMLGLGALIGGMNVIYAFALVAALRAVPGAIVFPTVAVGTLLLIVVAGVVIWRERHTVLSITGILLGTAGLVMMAF